MFGCAVETPSPRGSGELYIRWHARSARTVTLEDRFAGSALCQKAGLGDNMRLSDN
ncbi:hypothetical protein SBA4_3580023 [Candidatus Sulfopaludibacter sp. SbA4]|nr:hypothetical protein SBA4_3580023 [Candidatus Sulfopaludibacter sp. SbA4]